MPSSFGLVIPDEVTWEQLEAIRALRDVMVEYNLKVVGLACRSKEVRDGLSHILTRPRGRDELRLHETVQEFWRVNSDLVPNVIVLGRPAPSFAECTTLAEDCLKFGKNLFLLVAGEEDAWWFRHRGLGNTFISVPRERIGCVGTVEDGDFAAFYRAVLGLDDRPRKGEMTWGARMDSIRAEQRIVFRRRISPEEAANVYDTGLAFEGNGEWDRAIETYSRITESFPKNLQARHHLAICYRARGWQPSAVREWRVVAERPNAPSSLVDEVCDSVEKASEPLLTNDQERRLQAALTQYAAARSLADRSSLIIDGTWAAGRSGEMLTDRETEFNRRTNVAHVRAFHVHDEVVKLISGARWSSKG